MASLREIWKKRYGDVEGEQRYDAWREKISKATSGKNNPMYGRHDHTHGLKRYAKEKVGKTLEEVHGIDLASKIRKQRSEASTGSNNSAFGRVYCNGGKSVKGYYRGKFFRSLLEYSFMKHLEIENVSLDDDVAYECFVIPYEFESRKRTYRTDFYVKSRNIAYEIKPSYVMKTISPINVAKWKAATEFLALRGIQFLVVTESDFNKISFDCAQQDPHIVWKEETFKYFRKRSK